MNCDQAFESLTDPALRDATALQRHLHDCPRCRDLADALEPALHLFEDAGHATSLPEYEDWSSGYCDEPRSPAKPRRQISWNNPAELRAIDAQRRRTAWREGFKVAAILLAIGAFTAGIANIAHDSTSPLARVGEISSDACFRLNIDSTEAAPTLAACVACHVDQSEAAKLSHQAQAKAQQIVQRCVVCHLEKSSRQEIADAGDRKLPEEFATHWERDLGACIRLTSGG